MWYQWYCRDHSLHAAIVLRARSSYKMSTPATGFHSLQNCHRSTLLSICRSCLKFAIPLPMVHSFRPVISWVCFHCSVNRYGSYIWPSIPPFASLWSQQKFLMVPNERTCAKRIKSHYNANEISENTFQYSLQLIRIGAYDGNDISSNKSLHTI